MANAIDIRSSKSASPALAKAGVNDESIQLVVSQLRQLCRDSSLEFALRVGAVVIHNFYDGEVDAWRLRGAKAASFRRLSEHPDLPMSAAALYRCVALFELCERLNAPTRWRRLGASHFRSVLNLPREEQERLLSLANAQHWTVETLQAAAIRRRSSEPRRGGRKPTSTLVKNLSSIYRTLQHCQSDLEGDLRSLKQDEREKAAEMLARTREWVEDLFRMVEQTHGAGSPLPPRRVSPGRSR